MTDPGIVPARRWPDYVASKYDEPKDKLDYYYSTFFVNQRISTHLFPYTFCKTCQIWQPPRCNHCPICQTCVLELDHHCHWLGTCLGLRNYHSFYWYLVHLVSLSVFQLFFIPLYLWRLNESRLMDDREEEYLFTWQEWCLPVVCIYVMAMGTWICKLYYFHQCYVTTQGLTAYEMFKGHYMNCLLYTSPSPRDA